MESPKQLQFLTEGLYRVIKPFSIIEEHLLCVQAEISAQLCEYPHTEGVERLITHINSRPGKMLRPGLVPLSGLSCGQINTEHIKAAAIFELSELALIKSIRS